MSNTTSIKIKNDRLLIASAFLHQLDSWEKIEGENETTFLLPNEDEGKPLITREEKKGMQKIIDLINEIEQ